MCDKGYTIVTDEKGEEKCVRDFSHIEPPGAMEHIFWSLVLLIGLISIAGIGLILLACGIALFRWSIS